MIKHLLAYGQSDQGSFRDQRVARCFDTMTVPGTIASYFEDATAAFVLTLGKPYMIDPRTPLFQDSLATPRASHYTLAAWHGEAVAARIQSGEPFPADFYTTAVVDELVAEVVERQRNYGTKASGVAPKMNRYLRLLAEARGQTIPDGALDTGPAPESVLLPYFAVDDLESTWWSVMKSVWRAAAQLPNPYDLHPVICVGGSGQSMTDDINLLDRVLQERPANLSPHLFFWVTNFEERSADESSLRRLWEVVQAHKIAGVNLANLYGGFFSVCLGLAGLEAFGNGLGYSESRRWPALDATGAAPARYYLGDLHTFVSLATAAQLTRLVPQFQCKCEVCERCRREGRAIVAMNYAELKAHFALTRAWEIELTDTEGGSGVATHLRQVHATYRAADLPYGIRANVEYLLRWASVLEHFGT